MIAMPSASERNAAAEAARLAANWRGVAVDGLIVSDYPCVDCGYNLRGQATDGCCPECGNNIRRPGPLLRFADPKWLERVSRGADCVAMGAVIVVVGFVGLGVLTLLANAIASTGGAAVGGGRPLDGVLALVSIVVLGASGFILLMIGYGLVLLATPAAEASRRTRRWARVQQVIAVPATLCVPGLVMSPLVWLSGAVDGAPAVVLVVQMALVWLLLVLTIGTLRRLEARCAGFDDRRRRALQVYRSSVNALIGIPILFAAALRLAAAPVVADKVLEVVPMIGAAVFLPWLLVMFLTVRTRRALRAERAAQAARAEPAARPV